MAGVEPSTRLVFDFPVYGMCAIGNGAFAFCGGGGLMKSGIPNRVVVRQFEEKSASFITPVEGASLETKDASVALAANSSCPTIFTVVGQGCKNFQYDFSTSTLTPESDFEHDILINARQEQSALALSGDASMLAVASDAGDVHTLSLPDCELQTRFQSHGKGVDYVDLSEDGSLASSTSARDRSSFVWDAKSGSVLQRLRPLHEKEFKTHIRSTRFCPGNSAVLFAGESNPRHGAWVTVWVRDSDVSVPLEEDGAVTGRQGRNNGKSQSEVEKATFRLVAHVKALKDALTAMAVVADGRIAVSSSEGHVALLRWSGGSRISRLWSSETRVEWFRPPNPPHVLPVTAISFSESGANFVTASADFTVAVWPSRRTGVLRLTFKILCRLLALAAIIVAFIVAEDSQLPGSVARHRARLEPHVGSAREALRPVVVETGAAIGGQVESARRASEPFIRSSVAQLQPYVDDLSRRSQPAIVAAKAKAADFEPVLVSAREALGIAVAQLDSKLQTALSIVRSALSAQDDSLQSSSPGMRDQANAKRGIGLSSVGRKDLVTPESSEGYGDSRSERQLETMSELQHGHLEGARNLHESLEEMEEPLTVTDSSESERVGAAPAEALPESNESATIGSHAGSIAESQLEDEADHGSREGRVATEIDAVGDAKQGKRAIHDLGLRDDGEGSVQDEVDLGREVYSHGVAEENGKNGDAVVGEQRHESRKTEHMQSERDVDGEAMTQRKRPEEDVSSGLKESNEGRGRASDTGFENSSVDNPETRAGGGANVKWGTDKGTSPSTGGSEEKDLPSEGVREQLKPLDREVEPRAPNDSPVVSSDFVDEVALESTPAGGASMNGDDVSEKTAGSLGGPDDEQDDPQGRSTEALPSQSPGASQNSDGPHRDVGERESNAMVSGESKIRSPGGSAVSDAGEGDIRVESPVGSELTSETLPEQRVMNGAARDSVQASAAGKPDPPESSELPEVKTSSSEGSECAPTSLTPCGSGSVGVETRGEPKEGVASSVSLSPADLPDGGPSPSSSVSAISRRLPSPSPDRVVSPLARSPLPRLYVSGAKCCSGHSRELPAQLLRMWFDIGAECDLSKAALSRAGQSGANSESLEGIDVSNGNGFLESAEPLNKPSKSKDDIALERRSGTVVTPAGEGASGVVIEPERSTDGEEASDQARDNVGELETFSGEINPENKRVSDDATVLREPAKEATKPVRVDKSSLASPGADGVGNLATPSVSKPSTLSSLAFAPWPRAYVRQVLCDSRTVCCGGPLFWPSLRGGQESRSRLSGSENISPESVDFKKGGEETDLLGRSDKQSASSDIGSASRRVDARVIGRSDEPHVNDQELVGTASPPSDVEEVEDGSDWGYEDEYEDVDEEEGDQLEE